MRNKKDIVQQIRTYEKRRKRYKSILKNCRVRLGILRESLELRKNHEKRFKILKDKSIKILGNLESNMHRDFFCKYLLENGIKSEFIAKYLGYKSKKTVHERRRRCLGYFQNDYNRQIWQDYKVGMQI